MKSMNFWQKEMSKSIRKFADLEKLMDNATPLVVPEAFKNFPLLITPSLLKKIDFSNSNDPILLQFLPSLAEDQVKDGFNIDAVGDLDSEVEPGLLKKYLNRALLLTTPSCAVHCRYCFRKHFPYQALPKSGDAIKLQLEALKKEPQVNELVLSGGDPLMWSNEKWGVLIEELKLYPQIKRLRIHSRIPIVLPSRIEQEWLLILDEFNGDKIMVVHCNHANELGKDTFYSHKKLKEYNWILLNQSVLLKGVNDSLLALTELSQSLINQGVVPYYIHQLDRVLGTQHFEVSIERAKALLREFREVESGYMVPKFVQELPGEKSKIPIPF